MTLVIVLCAMLLPTIATAQQTGRVGSHSQDASWTVVSSDDLDIATMRAGVREWVRPDRFVALDLDGERLSEALAGAPKEFSPEASRADLTRYIDLPRPDGRFERFTVVDSPTMAPELEEWMALQGFAMKTYKVVSTEDPATWGRIDFGGPAGFHGVIRSPEKGMWYIDPYLQGNDRLHQSYWRKDLTPTQEQLDFECMTDSVVREYTADEIAEMEKLYLEMQRGGTFDLRVFRFACAATGEYTGFHGGTVVDGQAAVVTMTNRINEIYERDLAVRLVLVANNNLIIYTNAGSDPYTDGSTGTMLGENRTNLAAVIGNGNFDAGHVVGGIGSGGVAGSIGNICLNSGGDFKAEGATTRTNPIGDAFDIDYTAHELGHQFAGQHSWNYCFGGSGHGLSVEPGSGITIMGYASLCGGDDLASNSIAMFHIGNIVEMNAYIASTATCNSSNYITTSNSAAPTVDAGSNYTIPANTPFELTALNGNDTDGDTITYSWEQNDDGQDGSQQDVDGGTSSSTGPVFRTYLPDSNPTWSFPPLATVVAGGTGPNGENPSTVARTMNFRAVVRDNNPDAGRTGFDSMTVTTAASSGFAVTSPNGGESVPSGSQTVTWNVANTSSAPISTANVDVYLSTDSGATFPTMIASGIPNTGTGTVTYPSTITSTARLKIKGSGNIFYDVSNGDFSIAGITPLFEGTGNNVIADNATGFANGNGFAEPDEEQIELTVEVLNSGSEAATSVSATLISLTPTVTVTTAGPLAYSDLGIGAMASNATPFMFDIDPGHTCGAPANFRLTVTSTEGTNDFDFSIPTGELVGGTPLPEESFEGGSVPAGWTTSSSSGPNRWDVRTSASSDGNSSDGTFLASYEGPFSDVTDAFLVTPAVTGAQSLTFQHAYDVEDGSGVTAYDGMVLEITTNGGSNWTRLNSEITTGGYDHEADGTFGSPLDPGDECWSGESASFPAMSQVVVDLTAYTMDTIQIRFRYTEDDCCSTTQRGWFIDQVEISGGTYNCVAVPVELSGYVLE